MIGGAIWAVLLTLGLGAVVVAGNECSRPLDPRIGLVRRTAIVFSVVAVFPGLAVLAMGIGNPVGSLWWLAYLFAAFPVLFWGATIVACRFTVSADEEELTPDDLAFVGRVFETVDEELSRLGVPFEHQHSGGAHQAWLCRLGEGAVLRISACRMQELELLASLSRVTSPPATAVVSDRVAGVGVDYKLPLRDHVRLAMVRPGLARKIHHLLRGRRSEGRDWIRVSAEQRSVFLASFPPRIAEFIAEAARGSSKD